tara:strand:+ start:178 stop:681 length:504 start_codon:yes stop_codon:yes gene_type:complete
MKYLFLSFLLLLSINSFSNRANDKLLELFTEKALRSELSPIKEFLIDEDLPPTLHQYYLLIRCRSLLVMLSNNEMFMKDKEIAEVVNSAKDVYDGWQDIFFEKPRFSKKIFKNSGLDLTYEIYRKYLEIAAGKNPKLSWEFLMSEADYCNDGTLGSKEDLKEFLKFE